MAAGKPNPIVPKPPEVNQVRGFIPFKILRRKHLMLSNIRRDDRLMLGQLIELFDNVLRFGDFVILIIGQRMSLPPFARFASSKAPAGP